ncbi:MULTISPECIES: carbohydrate ABC transporter permease [Actinomycetaceae]|uniref:carbohydrate ABC transporter permease n=2 Tax=Actinomycetales TaxID=2037 RepID=UPI001E541FF7|nr:MULTISPECIES: sugar ABC transporter permease [Actinomycetaceae]MDU5569051.1 sugar ABC transporter permease [Actinomyces sp.]MDU6679369.1 sugar ABC transporter permease [Actinomyces sp.]MDU7239189.1 sugar ABC transporter permease [Actinomyces sp.]WIK62974.1 sugar ABC transporter permease [Gleimia europaea]
MTATSRRPIKKRRLRSVAPWLLLAPAIIMVLVALGYPLVRQAVMSFQHFGLAQQFGAPAEWAGLANYKEILTDPYFWTVFVKSVLFCLWTAGITMALGVLFAVLMLRLSKVVRTILNTTLVIVWAMPALASLTVWQWLVDPRSGLLNYTLTSLGLESFNNFNWLGGNFWTFYLIASGVIIWASMPLVTITIYAALAQVPGEILEAAQIDGASWRQQIVRIQLPMILPVIALIGVLQIIWDLRVFTQIYVLQQAGGIASETNLLGTYVYQTGIAQGNYGVASALAMVILLLTLAMTFKYLQMLYRQGGVE